MFRVHEYSISDSLNINSYELHLPYTNLQIKCVTISTAENNRFDMLGEVNEMFDLNNNNNKN